MDEVDGVAKTLSVLTLLAGFFQTCYDRMTKQFGENWSDASQRKAYMWGSEGNPPKDGDEAERKVIECLTSKKLCDLLEEPVYVISGGFEESWLLSLKVYFFFSGRHYCQLKREPERHASKWIIGENDIIFITRKLGIVSIEVKGNP